MNVDGAEFKAALRSRAEDLGAVAFGVAEAGPVADHGRLLAWLDRGGHGDMDWIARDAALRADPRSLLPGARSVICVALPYPAPEPEPSPPTGAAPAGRLAALFGGADYHRVTHAVLAALAEEGRRLAGDHAAWLPAVDTRPLLERSLAVLAGLGAIGRHTQLLVPGQGSLVCLGLLVTEAALPPDAPRELDPCAGCEACLHACPGAALHPNHGLHAPRCLSYATTASRSPIPEALRRALGLRVYGCDACLAACPWNAPERLAPRAVPGPLLGPLARPRETLEAWLTASGKALRRALAGTALDWLPPATLRRTLSVVLGNLGDPRNRPVLARLASDPADPVLAEHAAWALRRLEGAAP